MYIPGCAAELEHPGTRLDQPEYEVVRRPGAVVEFRVTEVGTEGHSARGKVPSRRAERSAELVAELREWPVQ